MIKSSLVEKGYEKIDKDFQEDYKLWLESLSQVAVESVRTTNKFAGSPSGPLRNEFLITLTDDGFEFESTPNYSSYVEEGRGAVVPVRAKFLRFVINGQVIFTKYSRPVTPRLFMDEAAKKVEEAAAKTAKEIFK